jgi:hypothetical protein
MLIARNGCMRVKTLRLTSVINQYQLMNYLLLEIKDSTDLIY